MVLDAAIKARIKQETDVSEMLAQRAAWMQRIEADAANRAAGDPMTISGGFGQCEGAFGNGFDPYGGGW